VKGESELMLTAQENAMGETITPDLMVEGEAHQGFWKEKPNFFFFYGKAVLLKDENDSMLTGTARMYKERSENSLFMLFSLQDVIVFICTLFFLLVSEVHLIP
jgi:hypothetical protein